MNYSCFARRDLRHIFSQCLLIFKANGNGVVDPGAVVLELAFVWLIWSSGIRAIGLRDSARTGGCVWVQERFSSEIRISRAFPFRFCITWSVTWYVLFQWSGGGRDKRRPSHSRRDVSCLYADPLFYLTIIVCHFPPPLRRARACVCGRFSGLRYDKRADTVLQTIFIR